MAKTGQDVINLCRSLLSTASGDYGKWNDDELAAYATEAQSNIAATMPTRLLGGSLVTEATETLAGGGVNPTFTKPANALRITDVLVERAFGAKHRIVSRLEDLSALARIRTIQNYPGSTNQSDFYAEVGDKFHLHPAYSGAVRYKIYYIKVPGAIVATSNIDLPDHLYEWICYHAVITALLKAGEVQKAGAFEANLQNKLQSFRQVWSVEPPLPFVSLPKQG
jgi:hypothetical protein